MVVVDPPTTEVAPEADAEVSTEGSPLWTQRRVKSLVQSPMHLAAMLAVQAVFVSMAARSSHETFASTPQVALHCELHLDWQVAWVSDLQLDEHWFPQSEPQTDIHWLLSNAPAQTARQLFPHRALQALSQSECASASQAMLQSAPHAVRQSPVAAPLHMAANPPPMSAWHVEAVSIWAQANGHWSLAEITH
jgi:hypothetical protein